MSDEYISDTEDEDDNGKLIAGAINGMLSTGKPDKYHREQDDFQSSSLPLGTNINKKIKSKIWSDEYVELKLLIKESDDPEYTFTVKKIDGNASIDMQPTSSKSSLIDNIDEWTTAMLV